ncbi:TPM domain-containing protein [Coraliomargarita sp. W4R72]
MFRRLLIVLFGIKILFCLQLNAAGGDELIARLQPTGSITDRANLLSPSTEKGLRVILDNLRAQTGASLVVVTLPTMEGGQIDDFTNRLFEKWGVGDADKDNGVMLLVSVAERKMRIEVGYGLEGVIPDGRAGQIRDQYVLAYFKQNQMEKGVEAGTLALANVLADHYGIEITSKPTAPNGSNDDRVVFVFLGLMVAFIIYSRIRNNNDGGGGHYGGRRYSRRRYYGAGGFYGGSSSRGGFGGGGGFSGGGFGGGMSGGGGASGGW